MTTKQRIEAAIQQERKTSDEKIQVLEALLKMTDPKTGEFPPAVAELFKSDALASVASKPRDEKPLSGIENFILTKIRTVEHDSPFDSIEWTSATVKDLLVKNNYQLPANPDAVSNAISQALNSLTANGLLERVHVGRGRDPHRYKSTSKLLQQQPVEERVGA